MKAKTESSRGAWRFAIVCTICLLFLLVATSLIFLQALRKISPQQLPGETEEIYVYLPQEDEKEEVESIENEAEKPENGYLVKEYQGQIGIFAADGTLLEILDTYVKTLPEADRSLLGEGISVKTREELNSLIEDYSH